MFNNKTDNPFIHRMNATEQHAKEGYPHHRGCADEILPFMRAFFKKLRNSKIKWEGSIARNIEKLGQLASHVSLNTTDGEVFIGDDMSSVKSIFDMLNDLYDEALTVDYETEDGKAFHSKISCLDEIACKNMVDMREGQTYEGYEADPNVNIHAGKIFQSYASLLKVLQSVNENWAELCNRGFSLHVFYTFWDTFQYNHRAGTEPSENEKLEMFLGLLDGTRKFHPQYEYKAVAFQVVPADFEETLVSNIQTRHDKGYQLQPKE